MSDIDPTTNHDVQPIDYQVEAMVGLQFHSWTVIACDYRYYLGNPHYHVRCVCGKTRSVLGYSLRTGRSQSCGCQRRKEEDPLLRIGKKSGLKRLGIACCGDCGQAFKRNGPFHKYCETCSNERTRIRQNKWAARNPPTKEYTAKLTAEKKSRAKEIGEALSIRSRWTLDDLFPEPSGMIWVRKFSVDFSYSLSKNHYAALTSNGHIYHRKESKAMKALISDSLALVLRGTQPPVENKIWIDMLVEKPDHLGDAVNILDYVIDGLKVALKIDDRWFSLRRVDWRIVKVAPKILIGIGQDHDWSARVCCYCGRVLPYSFFTKSIHVIKGIGRECRDCRKR